MPVWTDSDASLLIGFDAGFKKYSMQVWNMLLWQFKQVSTPVLYRACGYRDLRLL